MADTPDAPADDTGTVFLVGTSHDGTAILSRSGDMPEDETLVWLATDPDDVKSVAALETQLEDLAQAGDEVVWASEPEPWENTPDPVDGPPDEPDDDDPDPDDEDEEAVVAGADNGVYDLDLSDLPIISEAVAAAMTIDGEVPTGAMVALAPANPADLAVDGGDPPEALHVTLKYLGKADQWGPMHREAVESAARAWAAGLGGPMTASVGGAGLLGKDGAAVLFLDVPGLQDARQDLSDDIEGITPPPGVDVTDTYDSFLPHLATGYGVDPSTDRMGDPIVFDTVSVHWGPDVTRIPLDQAAQAAALSEVEVDELTETVEEAEERMGALEALVASIVLGQIGDDLFLDADVKPVAHAAAVDQSAFAAALKDLAPFTARVAALGDDIPDDLQERVEALMERQEKLEATVAEMMLGQVDDTEVLPGKDSSSFVNETIDRA